MKQYTILLARRSTDSQDQSLEYQVEEMQKRFPQYKPDKILRITETGDDKGSDSRKEFNNQFLGLIKEKSRQDYQVICLAYSIDRFTRNYYDLGQIHRLYKENGVKFYATDGKLENDQDALLFGVQVAFANNFLSNMKSKQRAGIINALKNGRILNGKIPGYKKTKKAGIKEPHPTESLAIKQFFKDYSTGKYSLQSYLPKAQKIAKKFGVKISKDGLNVILRNPFYIGIIRYKGKYEEIQGKEFKSASPSLLKKDLFLKVQQVLDGRHNKKVITHDFLYRGRIKTSEGGYTLAGGRKKTSKHIFYESRIIRMKSLREDVIDNFVSHYFENLPVNIKKTRKEAKKLFSEKIKEIRKTEKSIELENGNLKARLDKLTEMRLDDEITKEEYKTKKVEIIQRQNDLLKFDKEDVREKYELLNKFVEVFSEFFDLFKVSYKTLPREEKEGILENLVPNFFWDGENLVAKPTPLLEMIVNWDKKEQWYTRQDSNL